MTQHRAPSLARRRAAWRAGVRGHARFLERGLVCLALAAGVQMVRLRDHVAVAIESAAVGRWHESVTLLAAWWTLPLSVTVAILLAAVVTRRLGWRGPALQPALAATPRRPGWFAFVVAVVIVFAGGIGLRRVIAGAARAVDASSTGLATFWWSVGEQALVGVGLISLFLGVLERIADAQAIERALRVPIDPPVDERTQTFARREGSS